MTEVTSDQKQVHVLLKTCHVLHTWQEEGGRVQLADLGLETAKFGEFGEEGRDQLGDCEGGRGGGGRLSG